MQRSKSSRPRSSFTHRKRQRTPSAVEPSSDAGAEHESPLVDMTLPAPGEEMQPAVIGTLIQVAPLLWAVAVPCGPASGARSRGIVSVAGTTTSTSRFKVSTRAR